MQGAITHPPEIRGKKESRKCDYFITTMYEFTDFIGEVVGRKIRNRTTNEVIF